MRRGRSRHVSPAAIARQASEERRRRTNDLPGQGNNYLSRPRSRPPPSPPKLTPVLKLTPPTPPTPHHQPSGDASNTSYDSATIPPIPVLSPPSTSRSLSPSPLRTPTDSESCSSVNEEYYDSPPPPQSIEDQLHVAYALDDIRLAKIILLKLKGIIVDGDDDPRIDAVRDEDFDAYFVPEGGLVVDIDGRKSVAADVEEGRRRDREKIEERQRRERLKECERKWEEEKRRAREEKLKATRRREEEEKRKAEEIIRQIELEAERMRSQRQRRPGLQRSVVTYNVNTCLDSLPVAGSSKLAEDPFQYCFMPPTTLSITPRPSLKPKLDSPTRRSCAIPFKDVLSSMSGTLFPLEPAEQTRSHDHQTPFSVQNDKRCSWPMIHPSGQSKSRPRRTNLQCELLASLLKVVEWEEGERRRLKGKSTDLSLQQRQRTNSGPCAACFAVSSSSSTQTVSRSGSWLSFGGSSRSSTSTPATTPSTTPSTSPISSWLKPGPSFVSPPSKMVNAPLWHSCQPSNRMTLVAASESPLPLPTKLPNSTRFQKPEGDSSRRSSLSQTSSAEVEVKGNTILRRMSIFVDLAKGFPSAYIGASILNVAVAGDSRVTRREHSLPFPTTPERKLVLKPRGYRVCRTDVSLFLSVAQELTIPPAQAPQYIPLTNPHPPAVSAIPMRALTFPPPPLLPRSPFRPLLPPPMLLWRTRPVGNPVVLRLRALQNVLYQRGKEWEGRGRDGMLGCGRERLIGVAWEGLGRSGLSWEVTVVC